MIIDFHTHCFPEKIASRAIAALKATSGDMEAYTDGSILSLQHLMKDSGIDRFVVQSIATTPHQMHAVNDFAKSIQSQSIYCFGSIHPDAPDALEELERIKEMGLDGIKLHPEFQGFFVDEERMRPLYQKISELSLPLLFHAGGDISYMPPYKCTPKRLLKVREMLDTPIIAAHWGSYLYWEEVLSCLAGTDIYIDTSMAHGILPIPLAKAILNQHSPDRILFASDAPWQTPLMAKKYIDALALSQENSDKLFYKNAQTLLKR